MSNPFKGFTKKDLAYVLHFKAVMVNSTLEQLALESIKQEKIPWMMQMTTYENLEEFSSSREAFKLVQTEESFFECLEAYLCKESV